MERTRKCRRERREDWSEVSHFLDDITYELSLRNYEDLMHRVER